jgi:hypothetical protein
VGDGDARLEYMGAHAATSARTSQAKSPSNSSSREVACQTGRTTSADRTARNAESIKLKIQFEHLGLRAAFGALRPKPQFAAFHQTNLAPDCPTKTANQG